MEEIGNVFKALEEFLSYKTWSGDKVENIAREQIGIMKNPKPFVLFEDFGDSALLFSINFFINDSYGDPKIKSAMRYIIEAKFREHNISIPFPQRDVHVFQSRPIQTMQVEKKDSGNGN